MPPSCLVTRENAKTATNWCLFRRLLQLKVKYDDCIKTPGVSRVATFILLFGADVRRVARLERR